jgi:RNA polymerase sigma-70 factor, ECF subfamily
VQLRARSLCFGFGRAHPSFSGKPQVHLVRAEIEKAVELIRRKDSKSAEQALGLLQNTVFSFSMKVCGQRQDAEDTMQEVLLKSTSNLQKFDNPKALLVWLYKVAKNHCLMSRRKSKFAPKEALSLDELMPDRQELQTLNGNSMGTPETSLMRRENARHLRESVQILPPEYRLILVLHDMEELSDSEISEITGLRPGTIRVRLHRARLFVRKELARRGSGTSLRTHEKNNGEPLSSLQPRERRCKEMFAELSDYLDDQLDDSLCNELEKHIEGCEPCKNFLSSLEQTIQDLRRAPEEFPDPNLAAKLRRNVLMEYQKALSGRKKQV